MKFEFADCTLDTSAHELRRGGNVQKIEPKVFDLLALLAANAGQLVSQDEIIAKIWDGRAISDSAISACVAAARKAVGDDGKRQAIIRTVPRRGLQFVAGLEKSRAKTASPNLEEHPTIRYARAPDGALIAYHVVGDGPVLIRSLHFPTHLEMEWTEEQEIRAVTELSEHFTVVRYDHRGCGLSDRNLDGLSWEQMASDLIAVADAIGVEQFSVMGASSGTRIAVAVARFYPQRVRKLVLQGCYVAGRELRQLSADPILSIVKQGWEQDNLAFTRAYLSMYFPDAPTDWLNFVAKVARAGATSDGAATYRQFHNTTDISEFLEHVGAPTLILQSRDDAIHPVSEAKEMAAGLSGSELVILNSPNHYVLPHEKDWDYHLKRIIDFLSKP